MFNSHEIVWDLTPLFSSMGDPRLDDALADVVALGEAFEKKFRGEIGGLSAVELLGCLRQLEALEEKFEKVSLYAGLSFSVDMTSLQTQALHDKVDKIEAQLGKKLAFFWLELGAVVKAKPQIVDDSVLSNYRHLLEKVRRRVPHQLSELEEQLIIEKDQFGVNAWQELQSKWLNTRVFEVAVLGEKKRFSFGEAAGLFSHPDRATRESVNRSVYGLLGGDGEIFGAALRSICNDWVSVSRRRKYGSAMESSLISNDTEKAIIDGLLRAVEKRAYSYRKYLKLKAKLMELSVLGNHDLVAPLPDTPALKFSFEDAQRLITRAYGRLGSEFARVVEEMFAMRRIDASPHFGKRNGAFCASYYGGKSAFILSNFSGSLNDVYTLAHELGHATHDYYASRNQTILNTSIPSVVAETASIFGELLLTNFLLSEAESELERRAVLCHVLDEAGMTTFQVTARVWFEQSLYDSIRDGKYLDYNTVCGLWMAARGRIFGDAVVWLTEMGAEWTMKPHYFMPNYRFYNYPYVYAQLFVYALFERYLHEGETFVPKLEKALSAGSSLSPKQIGALMGLDVTAGDFWELGLVRFDSFVLDLEKIIS